MSLKVPLGLTLKNPAKVADMVDILDELHQYVPSSSITTIEDIPGQEEGESIRLDCFHRILCYGDQLTVERIRGAQAVRLNSENGIMQLRGFIPAVTDWHAKVSFLGVSYYNNSVLFSTTLF